MLKKFALILATAASLTLVACGGGGGSTTTTSYTGNYVGNVTGVNAGPANFSVDAANKVTGTFTITNRADDCASRGGTCVTSVTGMVDASGNFAGDFVDSGLATMKLTGKISGNTLMGTYVEYCCANVTGAFTATK